MSGVSLIARQVELNAAIVSADLVITGEGKIGKSVLKLYCLHFYFSVLWK
jgi:glycerate kinase